MRGLYRVLLTFALAALCGAYFLAEKAVTLAVGDSVRRVTTFAPTVEEALDRLGVEVGPHDEVVPSPDATPDELIEVHRAKEVSVVLDGNLTVETVAAGTVGEALKELSIEADGSYIYPRADQSLETTDAIVVAQPKVVTVVFDGKSMKVLTNTLTAGALLRELDIPVGAYDRVEPSIASVPGEVGTVSVLRISEANEEVHVRIPYKKAVKSSAALDRGVRKIVQPGEDGVLIRNYKITYQDGKVASRVLVSTKVSRPAQNQITLVGTRKPVFISSGKTQTGKASWYHRSGNTAAHRTLPKGTVVKVTNLANGKSVIVKIDDRGPYVAGRIIDLSDDAFSKLAPLGSGVVNVKIEW